MAKLIRKRGRLNSKTKLPDVKGNRKGSFPEALTYDDILLIPNLSDVRPSKVDLRAPLTNKIMLKIPLVSAIMDTVTEHRLATALALQGGIGIIHKNMTITRQVSEVKKVKRFEAGFIYEPIVVSPKDTIARIKEIKSHTGYSSFPVTLDGSIHGKLVGTISDNDYSFDKHKSLLVEERMRPFKELITAPKGISLERANDLLIESRHGKLVVIDDKQRLSAIVSRRDIEKNEEYPNACKDKNKNLRVAAAIGPGDYDRVASLIDAGADAIAIDSSHGHTVRVVQLIKKMKKDFGQQLQIIAGNIATKEATEDLITAGADCVKIGIGPGSICTTRVVTGVGVPQVTAIQQAVAVGDRYKVPVCADGGIKYSGDIAKALGLGASTVMIGSLFAGTEESPGRTVFRGGRKFKSYRGMGSIAAMSEGSADRYDQENEAAKKFVPEGVESVVPYKGTVAEVTHQLIGGVRGAMSHAGANNLAEFRRKARFVRITNAGLVESHPHDVTITEESPNYGVR